MMGCGSSIDTGSILDEPTGNGLAHFQQNGVGSGNIVEQFVQLDIRIGKLEATCPGPRMATIEAWIEHLQAERDMLVGMDGGMGGRRESVLSLQQAETGGGVMAVLPPPTSPPQTFVQQNGLPNGLRRANDEDIVKNTPSRDLANLAISLGVIGDLQKASTHEDFFANLSESALHLISTRYYTEILEHTKVRLKTLRETYAELNDLYINHDGIIAFISGGTYMSRLEETLDAQLETARDVREKLGSAVEQWRICGTLMRTCANSATQCLERWRQLAAIVNPREKIQTALACRNSLQASLVALDCAQLALPHVEMKFVSNRQILAVKHCNIYMITDVANLARYEHTAKVFATYESNMSKASSWLYETFNKTLRKDFEKTEEHVQGLAKTLRDHREEIFSATRK